MTDDTPAEVGALSGRQAGNILRVIGEAGPDDLDSLDPDQRGSLLALMADCHLIIVETARLTEDAEAATGAAPTEPGPKRRRRGVQLGA